MRPCFRQLGAEEILSRRVGRRGECHVCVPSSVQCPASLNHLQLLLIGEEERCAALGRVEAHCSAAASLLGQVHQLQAEAETLLGGKGEGEAVSEEGEGVGESDQEEAFERMTASYYSLAEGPAAAALGIAGEGLSAVWHGVDSDQSMNKL